MHKENPITAIDNALGCKRLLMKYQIKEKALEEEIFVKQLPCVLLQRREVVKVIYSK